MNILEQLPDPSWRGISFPITGIRDYGFAQQQAQHRFVFRDQQLIESIGRENPTLRFQIPFRENLRASGWVNLFTVVYPQFFAACQDRTAGDLLDPVHGAIRAKCVSLQESLDVTKRDGVDVIAEFVFAPEDETSVSSDFANLASSIQGLQASAVQFGADAAELSREQLDLIRSLNQPSQRADSTVLDAARSAATSVQQTKNKLRATLGRASFQMEQTRKEVEQARDPELELLRRDTTRFVVASKQLRRTATDPNRPYEVVRAHQEMTKMAFATFKKITVDELIEFNQDLIDMLTIPAGHLVKLPAKNG